MFVVPPERGYKSPNIFFKLSKYFQSFREHVLLLHVRSFKFTIEWTVRMVMAISMENRRNPVFVGIEPILEMRVHIYGLVFATPPEGNNPNIHVKATVSFLEFFPETPFFQVDRTYIIGYYEYIGGNMKSLRFRISPTVLSLAFCRYMA